MHILSLINTYVGWKYVCWLCYRCNICNYVICFIFEHLINYLFYFFLLINTSRKTLKAIVHLNNLITSKMPLSWLFRAWASWWKVLLVLFLLNSISQNDYYEPKRTFCGGLGEIGPYIFQLFLECGHHDKKYF